MAKKEERIVRLEGDWDISRRDELERLLEPAYGSPGDVILDMRAVDYADSTILAALVVLRNRRRSKGLPLPSLVVASRQVRRLLSISGLDEAFPTYESVEAAQSAGA
jgi:anti-anti-sigma factor